MTKKIEHVIEEGVEKAWCGKCKTFKPLDVFGKSKRWDGLRSTCKECLKKHNSEHKEEKTEYNKQYWQKTMDVQKAKNKEWREANPEKVKEGMKKWLEENSEHKKEYDKRYKEEHRDKYNEVHRIWMKNNYHKLKEEGGEQWALKKMKSNISRRIREILGQNKSETCMDYVGCSLEDFRSHIQSTFSEGMSWRNYGSEWHIDHKVPIAAWDHSIPEEVEACWHYRNLQALWAPDNIRKKDTFSQDEKESWLKTLSLEKTNERTLCTL